MARLAAAPFLFAANIVPDNLLPEDHGAGEGWERSAVMSKSRGTERTKLARAQESLAAMVAALAGGEPANVPRKIY